MQDIILRKQLYPMAKNLKHRSLGKYQMSVPLAKALIGQGYVQEQPRVVTQTNYLNFKGENLQSWSKVMLHLAFFGETSADALQSMAAVVTNLTAKVKVMKDEGRQLRDMVQNKSAPSRHQVAKVSRLPV